MVKTSESANAPEIISDHTRIMSLINRLYQERASLTITLPNSKLRSKSIILDLNSETGRFVLNKIQPDTAHEKLMGSRKSMPVVKSKGSK